jgi:hypothetical protein
MSTTTTPEETNTERDPGRWMALLPSQVLIS